MTVRPDHAATASTGTLPAEPPSHPAAEPPGIEPPGIEPPDAEAPAGSAVRALAERYAAVAGAALAELAPNLLELRVPERDRAFFRGRERVLLAFSLGALERNADADMAVAGSAASQQLVEAVRSRGARRALGLVPPTVSPDPASAPLGVPLGNATASAPAVRLARHPAGRLVARVLIRAGPAVEEHLVESGTFDLASGAAVPTDVAECCAAVERGAAPPADPGVAEGAPAAPALPAAELVARMTADLASRLRAHVERQRAEAERALAAELARIDGYYRAMLQEGDGAVRPMSPAERRAVETEYARRRAEEERRHHVRAVVHPLQMVELELLVQRAEWTLSTPEGRRGTVAAQRVLSGRGAWALACPTCAEPPAALLVCRDDHAACAECGHTCSVCGEGSCRAHGLDACAIDGAPACGAHARTCASCGRRHCSAHEGVCAEGEHHACAACLVACGLCGRAVCDAHATRSAETSPRGARRLCPACVVYCEGGRSEPVGRDEVMRCASCERSVCEAHQAACAVDGQVYCSAHLRRTDRSRRLVCESHRAVCAHEPAAVLAADEVSPCAACGALACATHTGVCAEDGARYCAAHLVPLKDRPGSFACARHHSVCHVDRVAFSLGGTAACPACERRACAAHMRPCASCGRSVCAAEYDAPTRRCATCRRLAPTADPSDAVLAAAVNANGGEPPSVKGWRVSRDATHVIVEMSHGWTRRTIFTVRHGETVAESVMAHSALGSSRRR